MKKILILLGALLFFMGCSEAQYIMGCGEAQNLEVNAELKISKDGIKYKITTIEGKRFIATQSNYGFWTFAGPID